MEYKSVDTRDPFIAYDYPEHKRNFNDLLHVDNEILCEERVTTARPRYSIRFMWAMFLGVMGSCFGMYYWLEDKKMFRPVLPKQYPAGGKTHYTFDLDWMIYLRQWKAVKIIVGKK